MDDDHLAAFRETRQRRWGGWRRRFAGFHLGVVAVVAAACSSSANNDDEGSAGALTTTAAATETAVLVTDPTTLQDLESRGLSLAAVLGAHGPSGKDLL